MRIPSNQLQAFFQLSQDLNFTKAANNINITQSAFSTRIRNLEESLQTSLFLREKFNVRLTEAGEKLLQYCSKVNSMEEEMLSDLHLGGSGELSGVIRLGGFSSILRSIALPSLAPILIANPELGIQIHAGELRDLLPLLKNGRVDFLISQQESSSHSVESIFLGNELNVLVESVDGSPKNTYLDHDPEDQTTFNYLKLKDNNIEKIHRRYLDDVYGLIEGVRLGLGRAILPRHLVENDPQIKILHPKTHLKVPIYLHFFKSAFQTKLESQVIEALKLGFK